VRDGPAPGADEVIGVGFGRFPGRRPFGAVLSVVPDGGGSARSGSSRLAASAFERLSDIDERQGGPPQGRHRVPARSRLDQRVHLAGGVAASALQPPRQFLGAARCLEEGGSLTILSTALIDTGSQLDNVLFEGSA
jgi:hypothetical protein